jgi:ABC-type antimicrobial peptide transport system permease subunit
LQKFNLAILFMGLLFSMILALFVVISVILIYGLLLVNVQQKSFEIGIKRMVGQSKFGLVKDVIFQTFFFSTPGIILAFMCSFVVLRLVYYYEFEKRLNLVLDSNPTWMAIYNALFLGIVIPLVS